MTDPTTNPATETVNTENDANSTPNKVQTIEEAFEEVVDNPELDSALEDGVEIAEEL